MARLKVAVLFGGRSGEHEVSLVSGASVAGALSERHDVIPVLIDRHGRWLLQSALAPEGGEPVFLIPAPEERGALRRLSDAVVVARPDAYFPVLHGTFGEDGTVQGLLDLAAVPYAGSGCAASAAAMDKELMKALFTAAGVPQTPYRVLRDGEDAGAAAARVVEELGLPLFVKPANLGSSVGVSKVKRASELGAALELAFAYDRKVVVEAAVKDNRELEVSILGNDEPKASRPGEIVPDREFYDYDSKYSPQSRTQLLIPAPLEGAVAAEVGRLGVEAFRAVDACGYARVDFLLDRASGKILVNEINTIPGFTSISMVPKLWAASGVPYGELVARLVSLALERHAERARLRTDYRP
jgi:D-alanine-D-alanine ligase